MGDCPLARFVLRQLQLQQVWIEKKEKLSQFEFRAVCSIDEPALEVACESDPYHPADKFGCLEACKPTSPVFVASKTVA
jgi:hypothetical protein